MKTPSHITATDPFEAARLLNVPAAETTALIAYTLGQLREKKRYRAVVNALFALGEDSKGKMDAADWEAFAALSLSVIRSQAPDAAWVKAAAVAQYQNS